MCRLIAVSNRALCAGDFEERIKKITQLGADVILREKDLSESEYERLLKRVYCPHIIAHSFFGAAKNAGCKRIQLPMGILRDTKSLAHEFEVGVSVHSPDEARQAQEMGAAWVIAGHVFETDCKKGLAGRGLGFIENVRRSVTIPVFAIGGITPQNAHSVIAAGADGVCVMSSAMTCPNIEEFIGGFFG